MTTRARRLVSSIFVTGLILATTLSARPAPLPDALADERAELPSPATFVRAQARDRSAEPALCPGYGNVPGLSVDAGGNPYITNIQLFLDTCPQRDPALPQILDSFQIRRDSMLVSAFPCTEPVSTMAVAQYTDELIALQVLRAMYYMDRGQTGHLPWTAGTAYDWMRAKIQGVNIVTGVAGGYCCESIANKTFFVGGTHNDYDREFDKTWEGISNVMAFYAHERRHLDGDGFPHSSCCGIDFGCDNSYDPSNLAPYGVQWWLERCWLGGDINVGVGCLSQSLITQDANWHLGSANQQFRRRFCYTQPPLLMMPATPGGPCNPRSCPCPTLTISPTSLPTAIIGSDYRQALSTGGGTQPYTYSVASGSLPSGLSLSASGVLAGQPTSTGSFTFSVGAQDARQCGATRSYTVTVARLLRHRVRQAR
jgi:hypothetical protein